MEGIENIYNFLKEKFPEAVLELNVEEPDPWLSVKAENLREVANFIKEDEELSFNYLVAVVGTDHVENLSSTYILYRLKDSHQLIVKVFVDKENPVVPTVSDIWRGAEWHERESYDLVGIKYEGHPDLRRILLPPDWEGHPLLKDYKEPEVYETQEGFLKVITKRTDPMREKDS